MKLFEISLENPPQVAWIGLGQMGNLPLQEYLLPDLWCIHLYRDPLVLRAGREVYEIKPGDATLIAPATPIGFHFAAPTTHWHFYAHFRLPNPASASQKVQIPAHQALGERFTPLCAALEAVMEAKHVPPARAQAQLWSVLWEMTQQNQRDLPDPLIRRAQSIIEERMAQNLSVAGLARELGVSHNHLTRRFRAQTGRTAVAFIREARLSRARHLLRHSTLPIKAIASQVGLGDFHSFGKALRRADGYGPRQALSGFLQNKTWPT